MTAAIADTTLAAMRKQITAEASCRLSRRRITPRPRYIASFEGTSASAATLQARGSATLETHEVPSLGLRAAVGPPAAASRFIER
jgi:hypothetical protein